ncbi:MAG: hypothetical protein RBU21_23970 [FCB group bacterium]|jgi:ABC-type protease/lipase transport system fused ATPase/permease subunit|nr:hypothetical protein [FCB group bacterium]
MKHQYLFFLGAVLVASLVANGGDKNFVAGFDAQWSSQNASNILVYVDAQVATNREVETLFARGLVAAYLQKWGRGATNYFGQAIAEAETNTSYSAAGRSNIVQMITEASGHFAALAEELGEPTNSVPSWDTNVHAVIFGELGDQAPFLTTLDRIANTE